MTTTQMTESQMWETFGVIDSLGQGIRHVADRLSGRVTIDRVDARTGHMVVRVLTSVPTADEARAVVADMDRDLRVRARRAHAIRRAERALDAE